MSKVLVTGGCGYIGSHVVRQLSVAGYQPIVLDNLSAGHAEALLHGETLVVGDFGDPEVLAGIFQAHKIEAVFHFAAFTSVGESVEQPLKFYRNNSASTLALLESMRTHGVWKFILSSTAAVYGEQEKTTVSETSTTRPISPYGRTKLIDEWMVQDFARADSRFRYGILRYFNVAGAEPEGRVGQRSANATHLIKIVSEAALGKREHVTIHGVDYETPDGTGVRDYIHVEDLASAHVALLESLLEGAESNIFNCGYGVGFSVRQVLDCVREIRECSFSVLEGPRRPGDIASLCANSDKIQQTLGWAPKYNDLSKILKHSVEWEEKLGQM